MVTITAIHLHRIVVPLKKSFVTHLQEIHERESIIVQVVDSEERIGLGECVAFSSPWYTEETTESCWDVLTKWLIPLCIGKTFTHVEDLIDTLAVVKGNRMAKAALDMANWDLFAQQQQLPLWKYIGGTKTAIEAGVVLTGTVKSMYEKAEAAIATGYTRVKVKIDQNTNPTELAKLIASFPPLLFFADANGIFDQLGIEALETFDNIGLTLIEQPFGEDEWKKHEEASKMMKTAIALDESLRSVTHVEQMITSEAASIIVLKPSRVGGITASKKIMKLAEQYNIPVWIGGMIEFGISKAHNLALASCQAVSLPGDFSKSNHFWEEDITLPTIELINGRISLLEREGLGVILDEKVLEKYSIETFSMTI